MWSFGSFRLDPENACLWRGPQRLPLRPKTYDLLVYLVTHAGELVRKEVLFEAVWPDATVADGVLTTSMGELRKALRETAKHPRFIATVHRRGYRFVAPVIAVDQVDSPVSTSAHSFRSAIPSSPTLVEREAQLARLQQWFAAASQGQRQVALVTGEAGIGKSVLVDAFLAQFAAHQPPWIGRGQCLDHYGAGEAYLPLLEALGEVAHAADGTPFTDVLRQHAPSWLLQLPALVSPHEAQTLQQETRGATRERMLRELAEAVEVLTQERPGILILEDLHWGDVSTLDWLAYVARRRAAARLLVLGTYRPADAAAREHPIRAVTQELRAHGQCEELALSHLSEAGVTAYLEQRLGKATLPRAFIRTVHRRTNGNPLFLAAVVDEMQRRGPQDAREDEGERLATGPVPDVADIPESLRLLIDRQLTQLRPEERACLEVASVAGREFSAAAVAAGLEAEAEEVEAQYAALARRGQFVRAHGTEEWPDGTIAARYGFLHDLYHEFLYEQVPLSRRARWHQQIGARIEAGYGVRAPEIAAELAVHFERGRDGLRAVHYRRQAAQNALRRHGHREAIAHCTAGLDVLAALPETPERTRHELAVRTILGPASITARGYAAPEVGQTYIQALELCDALGDPPERSAVLFGLAAWHFVRGECAPAHELTEQLLQLARRRNDPALLMEAHAAMGTLLLFRGELTASWAHLEAGLALYDPHQHGAHLYIYGQDPGLVCLMQGADNLWCRGYPDQALDRLHAALELARGLSHPGSLAYTMLIAALLHQRRGEVDAVRKWADAAITLATEHAFPHWLALGTMYIGWALAAPGHVAEGIAQIQQGLAGYRATGIVFVLARWLGLLAEVHGRNGQAAEGLALLPEAFATMQGGQRKLEAEVYRIQGELLAQVGGRHLEEAEASLLQALALARQQEARGWELRAAISLSRLWQRQGKRAEAYDLLMPVYGWFTEGFDTADLRDARALLKELRG